MSLKNNINSFEEKSLVVYNGKEAFKVPIELKEALFSKFWNLYFQ